MTDTPDPRIVRDFARRAILSSAEDVDYIGIGEQFSDDENWPTEETAYDAMLEAVDAERQKAIVTVSWADEPAEQPQNDEAQHARTFLADLRENVTSYHQPLRGQPEHCTCGGASGCDRGGADLAAIATLEAVLNAAAPQYTVDGQPVDRESYEAWADEGRERDYDEAGIYYDEHDADEDGGPF